MLRTDGQWCKMLDKDLALMRLLDEQYTRMPFYGVRKMTAWLKTVGCYPDVKRVRRLLRGQPDIFNSDQGVQFTCSDFTGRLEKAKVQISMDGRGRCFDNIFVERLWRSVKYEDIFPHDYETMGEVRAGLGLYFPLYNDVRLHESPDYQIPGQVYFQGFAGGHA